MLAINMCEHVTAYGFYLPYEDSSYHDPQPSWEYKKWDFDFSAGFASTMKEGDQDTSNRAPLLATFRGFVHEQQGVYSRAESRWRQWNA